MSRRDTIIIAVLVNAGLLMVLFATAMREDKTEQKEAKQVATVEEKEKKLQDLLAEPLVAADPEPIIFSDALEEEDLVLAATFEEGRIEPAPYQKPQIEQINESQLQSFVVKKGDTLDKIAKSHGTSVAAIMQVNQLTSTQLKIGQTLKIPTSGKTQIALPNLFEGEEFYIVKEGDNPWMIATKNKVKWEDLLRLNNLDEQKARRLRPGDKLRLR